LTTAVFDLPYGRGRRWGANINPLLDKFIGGWSTSNILLAQSGPYQTPFYSGGNDPSGTAAPFRPGSQRPDRLPASDCSGLTSSQGRVFGDNCFFYGWPGEIGRFGDSSVGILRAAGTINWNFGIFKTIPVNERARFRFQATFTNFANHVNPGVPGMRANAGAFGLISSVQKVEGAGARTIQFALRLDF